MAFLTGDTLAPEGLEFLEGVRRPTIENPFSPDDVRRVLGRLVAERAERRAGPGRT